MAYEPTNWKNGDVITAEKLNKIENAVEDLSIGARISIQHSADDTIKWQLYTHDRQFLTDPGEVKSYIINNPPLKKYTASFPGYGYADVLRYDAEMGMPGLVATFYMTDNKGLHILQFKINGLNFTSEKEYTLPFDA